jgi:DNA recombination protein RmuC
MGKAQNNIQTGLNQLDEVMGKRTRAIQRKLRTVEVLENGDNSLIIPEITDAELLDDDIEN